MPHRSSETVANTGGNNHTEADVPLATPSTTIRKLCRNRGLVSQDEMIATGSQGVMENEMLAMGANEAMEDEMVAAMGATEAVGDDGGKRSRGSHGRQDGKGEEGHEPDVQA